MDQDQVHLSKHAEKWARQLPDIPQGQQANRFKVKRKQTKRALAKSFHA